MVFWYTLTKKGVFYQHRRAYFRIDFDVARWINGAYDPFQKIIWINTDKTRNTFRIILHETMHWIFQSLYLNNLGIFLLDYRTGLTNPYNPVARNLIRTYQVAMIRSGEARTHSGLAMPIQSPERGEGATALHHKRART